MNKRRSTKRVETGWKRMKALSGRAAGLPEKHKALVKNALGELAKSLQGLSRTRNRLDRQAEKLAAVHRMIKLERCRYQELFQFSPEACLSTDTKGIIMEANKAAAILLGARKTSLLGKHLVDFIAAKDHKAFRRLLHRAVKIKRPENWEPFLKPRTAKPFPVAVTVAAGRGPMGESTGIRWHLQDITEKKKHEHAAKLASFPELNPNPVLEVDRTGRVYYLNPAAQVLFPDLVKAGGRHPFLKGIRRELDKPPKTKKGRIIRELKVGDHWYGLLIHPVSGTHRRSVYAWDITERRRAEEALRQSEQRFRLALKNAPVSVAAQDRDLRFLWAYNQRTVQPAAVIGKTDSDVFPPEDAARLMALKRKVLKTGEEVREQLWLTSGGQRVFLELYLEPMRDETGHITGIGIATVDLTQMKLAEERIHHQNMVLEGINRIFREALRHETEKDIGRVCLKVAEEITGSTFGFLAEIDAQTGRLDDIAISDPGWKVCRSPDKSGHGKPVLTGFRITGLYGRVLLDGRGFYTNHPASHPSSIGTPQGHPPLKTFLGVPLVSSGKTVGVVAMANREGGYRDEDLAALEALAEPIRQVLMRRRAEEALKLGEQRYHSLFDSMTEGFALHEIICDDTGRPIDYRFLEINPAFERLTGLKRENVLGRLYNEVLPGDDPFWVQAYGAVALTGEPVHFENYSPALKRHYDIFSFRPAPGQFAVLFMDITERKALEAELRKSRDELELRVQERTIDFRRQASLLDLSHDAILVRDLDGLISYWNKGAESIYGWTKREAVGRRTHDLFRTQYTTPLKDINARILSDGLWEGDLTHTCKDGRQIVVYSRHVLGKPEERDQAEILEINMEVTERRQMEERLRQLQKMEALGTLAGGIAHDFNNILMPILINTELAMYDTPKGSPLSHYLAMVLEATKRGKDLVQQIIAFSRQREQRAEPVDLTLIIQEALKLLRASIPKNVEIRKRLEPGSCIVRADPTQIHQIIMNLGANASHAMRETGGRLDVRLETLEVDSSLAAGNPELKTGPYCRLAVSDTGQGMSPEVQAKAFDPFFTTKGPGEGAGMGLAVVHSIVKNHGGSITVYSEPGKGTSFNVYLPRMQGDLKEENASETPIEPGTGRILFVDDEEIVVRTMLPMLERLGYVVTGSTTALEALELFKKNPGAFDLIITDQTMPALTGEKLASAILDVRPDIPIILSTGFSAVLQEDEAKGRGIREIILKPYSISEIAARIRKLLKKE